MQIKKIEDKKIGYSDWVDYTEMGNVVEVKQMEYKNNKCAIKVIDKDHYVILSTGELCESNHIENRSENTNSIRNTIRKLRQIINCNVADEKKCRWITITYTENMTDSKQLYKDTEKLIKRVRYKFGHFEYINVAEPQGRGAWHLHCIWIFKNNAPYISQKWLTECWGLGKNVTVKKLDENCDNLGAYLSAYLGDMSIEDCQKNGVDINGLKCSVKEIEVDGEKQTKAYIKGARLSLYPPKFNLYRCSRGIKRPVTSSMPYFLAKEKISSAKLTFKSSVIISDGDKFSNTITKEYYNTKRTEKQ